MFFKFKMIASQSPFLGGRDILGDIPQSLSYSVDRRCKLLQEKKIM